jgi:hypothetical protein
LKPAAASAAVTRVAVQTSPSVIALELVSVVRVVVATVSTS